VTDSGSALGDTVVALARAAQPPPTVVVTGISVLLLAIAGNPPGECALLAAAVLAGQLTVGWSNDLLDVAADAEVGRYRKPLAAGELSPRLVGFCLAAAVLATVLLCLAAGWRPGLTYLFGVGCGWLYNIWLKGTWFSWLPYSLGLAVLPAMATLALSPPRWPAGWAIGAAMLLGIAANLTNTLPDLAEQHPDRFRGLPDRIGARPALLIAGVLVVLAACWVAAGSPGTPLWLRWAGPVGELLAAVLGIPLLWQRAESRAPFYAMMATLVVPAAKQIAPGRLR
jgi:4-hydroxybenzoate polyprenyltransferase